jgi:hypothetical protein
MSPSTALIICTRDVSMSLHVTKVAFFLAPSAVFKIKVLPVIMNLGMSDGCCWLKEMLKGNNRTVVLYKDLCLVY